MDLQKLETILAAYPKFRLKQAYQAIFKDFVEDWEEVTVFPKELRTKLAKETPLEINAKFIKTENEKTVKALMTLDDSRLVETVLMRHKEERNTVCVSSQVGCPMGCAFCATGDMGFMRNLECGEIVDEVLLFARQLKKENQRVTNVVFMGMGEPLLNYTEVMKAIHILNKDIGIAARHISVSTCGIIDGIKKLMNEPTQLNLAISFHGPNNEIRSKLMPINKRDPIEILLPSVGEYLKKTGRKVMIEYLVIKNVNDSADNARELAGVLKKYLGHLFMVNLIPYNPTGKFQPPTRGDVEQFRKVLESSGVEVTQRYEFGREVSAACGQLATRNVKK